MVMFSGKEVYAICIVDGEYDSYRHCVIGLVNSPQEAKDIVAELNLIHENEILTILKEESEVYNYVKENFGIFNDSTFEWEGYPIMNFKED